MSIYQFIKQRPQLIWYVAHPEHLSKEAIVEAVLNNGNWKDVQDLMHIVGEKSVARIFRSQIRHSRQNYHPKIVNYFTLYFNRYAH